MGEGLQRARAAVLESQGKHTCCHALRKGSIWHRYDKPCGKTAKFERDGKWYCGTHDPEKRRAREADWDAKFKADNEAARKKAAREKAAMELLELFEQFDLEETDWTTVMVGSYRAIMARAKEAL